MLHFKFVAALLMMCPGMATSVTGPEPGGGAPLVATYSQEKPAIVSIRQIASGQRGPIGPIGDISGERLGHMHERGAGTLVLDNLSSPGSSVHLNVAYLNPGSYNGSDPSSAAIVLAMADRLTARAPFDQSIGLPIPTDIVWNEYMAAPSAWPGSASSLHPLHTLSLVCYISNVDGPNGPGSPRQRLDALQVRFFTADGLTDLGGFQVTYDSPPNYIAYFLDEFDLSGFTPPIVIPRNGLVMLDWVGNNLAGVGSMLAGGDLIHPDFPRPHTLYTLGTTDPTRMKWADGIIGIGGYPNFLNPGYDGNPSSTSYLDVLNTGEIANWNIHFGDPPFREFCRDFPMKIVVGAGSPACPCDVDSSGFVNSQDFFDFLVSFFSGTADFNGSGATDSQDFFDFLVCFFVGC